MTNMTEFTFLSTDGKTQLHGMRWEPEGRSVRAVLQLCHGVAEHIAAIDAMLDEHSTGWKVKRMGVVDRNILRIAAWEIMFNDDVPNMVAIDEALSLAKTLCDDDSPAFIHGLLSAVSADAEATEVAEQPTEPSAE